MWDGRGRLARFPAKRITLGVEAGDDETIFIGDAIEQAVGKPLQPPAAQIAVQDGKSIRARGAQADDTIKRIDEAINDPGAASRAPLLRFNRLQPRRGCDTHRRRHARDRCCALMLSQVADAPFSCSNLRRRLSSSSRCASDRLSHSAPISDRRSSALGSAMTASVRLKATHHARSDNAALPHCLAHDTWS